MEEEKKQETNEEVKIEAQDQMKDEIDEALTLSKVEEVIKNAAPVFEHDGTKYRVRQPTYKEKQDAYAKKVEKFNDLLMNSSYDLEDILKEKYKKKGLDVDKITSEMNQFESERNKLQYKLGELVKKGLDSEGMESLKNEIETIQNNQYMLSIKRTNLLQYSIENQVLIYVYQYLTYVVTEKEVVGKDLGEGNKEPNTWVKAWDSFEDFLNSDGELINKASFNATMVIGQV